MRLLAALTLWLGLLLASGPAVAQTLEELIAKLPEGSFSDRAAVVSQIAATGDERAAAVLDALQAGDLAAAQGRTAPSSASPATAPRPSPSTR